MSRRYGAFVVALFLVLSMFYAGTLQEVVADSEGQETQLACNWTVDDPHKMHHPQLPDETGWAVNATRPLIVADDFLCTESGQILDFHFWGAWRNGIEGQVNAFVLSIHSDIPADPPSMPFSKPGQTLWELTVEEFEAIPFDPPTDEGWYDPANGEVIHPDHNAYFQYNICLDPDDPTYEPFTQVEGTIYWLNISAIVEDPDNTKWGWKSTQDHWNDDCVWATWGNLDWVEIIEPDYETISNNFWLTMLPGGVFGGGGGSDAFTDPTNGDQWFYYPESRWWNVWFYDHPYDPNRLKIIHIVLDIEKSDPDIPNNIMFAVNWSTDVWSLEMNPPGEDRIPPLPGVNQVDNFIGRYTLLNMQDAVGRYTFDFVLPDYNPEWVSIDVQGENFVILETSVIEHSCVMSMDQAFVITNVGDQPVSEACCWPNGSCTMEDPTICVSQGGTPQGLGSNCTGTVACCMPDGRCIDLDPLCCVDQGGTPDPTRACITPEACCLPDGSCQMLDPVCCVNISGTPMGTGSQCGGSIEACCLPDGSCVMMDHQCCVWMNGRPQGAGSQCSDLEACCLPDGTCQMLDPLCCVEYDGEAKGPGTTCDDPGICETEVDEACCLQDGSCVMLLPSECVAQGGTPQGFGQSCSAPEACCFDDGRCITLDPLCCNSLGGNPQGVGTACEPSGVYQACCMPDGSCVMLDPICCLAVSGRPQGEDTYCTEPAVCCLSDGSCIEVDPLCCDEMDGTPSPWGAEACGLDANANGIDDACEDPGQAEGACCLPDNTCVDHMTPSDCNAQTGIYQGDGTYCLGDHDGNGTDDVCDDPWNPDPGDDIKMVNPQFPDEEGWDVNATWPVTLADDWRCIESGPVKDLHFWGSWLDGVEGKIIAFVFSIHEDIPEVPGQIPYSRPGALLWEYRTNLFKATKINPGLFEGYYDPQSGMYLFENHMEYFQYDVNIPENMWFMQEEGTIYWLNISAVVEEPNDVGPWGWKSSQNHWNDDAVWGFDEEPPVLTPTTDLPTLVPYDPPNGESLSIDVGLLPAQTTLGGDFWIDSFFDISFEIGGNLGGEIIRCQATLGWHAVGEGGVVLDRELMIPINLEIHTGPRAPHDPANGVQTEIVELELSGQGELFGDPDFCVLRVILLPSPGITTLTPIGGDDFMVESFFDISYEIEIEGCPDGRLADIEGISVGTIPAGQGNSLVPLWTEMFEPPQFEQSLDLAFIITGGGDCDCVVGDANGDGDVNIGDAVYMINLVFKGGPPPIPYPLCSGDANCDCEANVGDAVYVINLVFKGGPPPCDCQTWLSLCGPPLRK